MGSRYLTDLAEVCRAIGVRVHEESGWQTRARSSGGYNSGLPSHVMCHHTASNPSSDGQSDVNYMCYSSDNRPVANLYLSRKGEIWIMAAGATNTNGKGHDSWGGGVPNDSMNTYAIGIEAANNGVGEPWPMVQQNVYGMLVVALCSHYHIPNSHVRAHFEWAPDRKIDPAGQSKYATGSNKWDMNLFRSDCAYMGPPTPIPPAPMKGVKEMAVAIQAGSGSDVQKAAVFAWNGIHIQWLVTQEQVDIGKITGILQFQSDGTPLKNFDATEIQAMIDKQWAGGPVPVGYTQP